MIAGCRKIGGKKEEKSTAGRSLLMFGLVKRALHKGFIKTFVRMSSPPFSGPLTPLLSLAFLIYCRVFVFDFKGRLLSKSSFSPIEGTEAYFVLYWFLWKCCQRVKGWHYHLYLGLASREMCHKGKSEKAYQIFQL